MASVIAQATELLRQLERKSPDASGGQAVGGSFAGPSLLNQASTQSNTQSLPTPPTVGGATSGNALIRPVVRPSTQTSVGGSTSASAMNSSTAQPYGFYWNGKWYYQVAPPGDIDLNDMAAVKRRVLASVVQHIKLGEGQKGDFSISSIDVRAVNPQTDASLLSMDPGAKYVTDVRGSFANGEVIDLPVVVNNDASTYVDPIRF